MDVDEEHFAIASHEEQGGADSRCERSSTHTGLRRGLGCGMRVGYVAIMAPS